MSTRCSLNKLYKNSYVFLLVFHYNAGRRFFGLRPQNDIGDPLDDIGDPQNDIGDTQDDIGDPQDDIGDPQDNILGYKDYPHSASNSSLVSFSFFKSSSAHLISTSLFSDMSSCAFL